LRKKKQETRVEYEREKPDLSGSCKKWVTLGILILSCIAVFAVYRALLDILYEYVLIAYMVILAFFVFAYLIYNRGMSRKGVTVDMLPEEWSAAQKEEFVREGKERLHRSRWMLIVILAFTFTLAADFFVLYFLPMIQGWFSA
jgi:hypothetical protein